MNLNIELQIEHLFKMFSESTDYVLTYSNLSKLEKEPDLNNNKLNEERKKYENLDEEKLNKFNSEISEYSKKIMKIYEDLENTIDNLPNKEEYNKSEHELKEELKEIKIKQQSKIDSINDSVELAKETLKMIELGQQNSDMFHEI